MQQKRVPPRTASTWLTRRAFVRGVGAVLAAGVPLAGYAFGIEPRFRLNETRYRLTPPRWPAGLKLKLAVLADLHAGEPYMPTARIAEIVQRTNALAPDVTLLLGDFGAAHRWQTRHVPAEEWARELAQLKAPLGVHAMLGNHDWWDDKVAQRTGIGPVFGRRALERFGIPVYENDCRATSPRVGRRSGSRASAIRSRWSRAVWAGACCFQGLDDLPGTLAQGDRSGAGHSAGARAGHLSAGAGAGGADYIRPHPWRAGAIIRLFTGCAVAVRQSLCLRAYRRGWPGSDRVRRARLLDHACAVWHAAGDRGRRTRLMCLVLRDQRWIAVLLPPTALARRLNSSAETRPVGIMPWSISNSRMARSVSSPTRPSVLPGW